MKNTIQSIYYEQINPPFQVWFQNSRARDRRESKIPPLVPLANPASQTTYEQPLDLSKKEGLAESVRKDSNAACVKFASSSPVEQRNDNASSHNQDADDLEDSPLVIDEETSRRFPETILAKDRAKLQSPRNRSLALILLLRIPRLLLYPRLRAFLPFANSVRNCIIRYVNRFVFFSPPDTSNFFSFSKQNDLYRSRFQLRRFEVREKSTFCQFFLFVFI